MGSDLATMNPGDEDVRVGTLVTLLGNRAEFEAAFEAVGYVWDDAMSELLGATVEVVDRPKSGIFGLPECIQNSGQPVWWYPFSVIERIECEAQSQYQLDLASPTYRDELQAIFRRIDEDGNGSLDACEIKGALSSAGLSSALHEIQVIISDCDPEGIGVIEWSSFEAAMQQNSSAGEKGLVALVQAIALEMFGAPEPAAEEAAPEPPQSGWV